MSLPGKIQDRVVISNLPRNYEPTHTQRTNSIYNRSA